MKRSKMNSPLNHIYIGDVHREFEKLKRICRFWQNHTIIGIGDVGLMLGTDDTLVFPSNFRFFRGNHDNPQICRNHPQYMVDYGIMDGDKSTFYVAGGFSVDANKRVPGVDWWADEQLSREDMEMALQEYSETKPELLVCHEAPYFAHKHLTEKVCEKNPYLMRYSCFDGNATAYLIEEMVKIHKPDEIVCGHWHISLDFVANDVKIRVLNRMELYSRYLPIAPDWLEQVEAN